jgi:hypothetical protein
MAQGNHCPKRMDEEIVAGGWHGGVHFKPAYPFRGRHHGLVIPPSQELRPVPAEFLEVAACQDISKRLSPCTAGSGSTAETLRCSV